MPFANDVRHVHIALRLKGNQENMLLFHQMCKWVDRDWPFITAEKHLPEPCEKCKGFKYQHPMLGPQMIKRIARQAGLRACKIRHFAKETECA